MNIDAFLDSLANARSDASFARTAAGLTSLQAYDSIRANGFDPFVHEAILDRIALDIESIPVGTSARVALDSVIQALPFWDTEGTIRIGHRSVWMPNSMARHGWQRKPACLWVGLAECAPIGKPHSSHTGVRMNLAWTQETWQSLYGRRSAKPTISGPVATFQLANGFSREPHTAPGIPARRSSHVSPWRWLVWRMRRANMNARSR